MILNCTMKYKNGTKGLWTLNTLAIAYGKKEGQKSFLVNKETVDKLRRLVLRFCTSWTSDTYAGEQYGTPFDAIINELEALQIQMEEEKVNKIEMIDANVDENTKAKIIWYKALLNDVRRGTRVDFCQKKNPSLKTQDDVIAKVTEELDKARSEGFWMSKDFQDPRKRLSELNERLERISILLPIWRKK